MKRISVLLIVVLLLSALVLPGLAYAKNPAGTPGKGPLGLGAAGKPSSTPSVRTTETSGPAPAETKGKKQGWKKLKFVLQGTVKADVADDTFELINITGGTIKRLKSREINITSPVPIKIKAGAKFRPKGKKSDDLKAGVRVTVKGKIVPSGSTATLEATMIIIKPKPKSDD